MIHSSHILSNPLSQERARENRPGLPLKPRDCELQGDSRSWCMSPSAYSCLTAWSWSLGLVGSRSRTLIPSVATALSRIKAIASTEIFSRTSTLHLLSRAAFTWKDGFSVVAPIRVSVPHSTWGRKVSYRYAHILKETANMGGKQGEDNDRLWSDKISK